MGVPTVVAGGLVVALAQGALAANITVSGTQFKLSADKLVGDGFTQYSGYKNASTGTTYMAMSGIQSAELTNLCQSVSASGLTLRIEAGKDASNPVKAKDLLIGMSELGGDATFENIQIGLDASTLDADGQATHGGVGQFGQQATKVTINNLKQKAYYTQASTFTLNGMSLKFYVGGSHECYSD
ncbi:DUF6230 family protein [Actinoplanes sp. NPDC051851]|uniref:DUF6230 family protein n=1 Tax=Actinoplanes sp. NPDC051851 TaxID=3154753 RepID=UPI0034404D4F